MSKVDAAHSLAARLGGWFSPVCEVLDHAEVREMIGHMGLEIWGYDEPQPSKLDDSIVVCVAALLLALAFL